MTKEVWAECARHFEERILKDFNEQVGPFATTIKPMVIQLGEDSDSGIN